MAKYKIEYLPIAIDDLDEIFNYIAEDDPKAAAKLLDEIDIAIQHLEEFPNMGTPPENRRLFRQGYRVLIIGNYLVFYVLLDNETVEIRRIVGGKRDYKALF